MKKIVIPIIFVIMLFFLIFPFKGEAAEGDVDFSVKAMIPENQIHRDKTYFDLRMEPGQKQEIKVIVYNSGKEEIQVKVSVVNASTNRNGLIVYEAEKEMDPSLTYPLTDIVTIEKDKITIPANESKTIKATIQMPDKEFDGIILGGLHFEKINENEEKTRKVQLENQYVYVIGVQLSENDNPVKPELHLRSIEPQLVDYRTAVVCNIQNSKPVIVENLTIHGAVYKKGSKKVLHESKKENIKMAPNSNMDFVIDWENQKLEAGDYLVKVYAVTDEEKWQWEETLTIEKEDEALNDQAVELENDHTLWYIIGIVVLVLIIMILLIIIWRLKNEKKANEEN